VAERVPTEMAYDSDFPGRRFQVRLVQRTGPVRQFAFAVRAGEYPVLIDRVWTLQSPVPQDLRQPQIERNRLARGFGLAVPDVLHHDRADDMDFHLLKINVLPLEAQQLPNPKAREHGEKYHRARRLFQDAKQCRNLLDGKHNGHPGPLGALTHHAYGIHTKPLPPDSVIENGTHDVSSFGFASVRILERPKPLLDSDCLDLGDAIASPTRQNPLVEIALIGDLRLPCFAAIRPQFLFPVVSDERLNTNRCQAGARILRVFDTLRNMRNNVRNMRSSPMLTALFPQVRQGVLAATLGQPDKWWYLSELADRLGTSPSSLQRELSSLVSSGILVHRREGTRAYFKAETQSPVFRDLQQLFEKTAGLAPTLEQLLKPLGNKIQCAFIYGSVARSREHAMSDVDVMVIGRAGLADLSPALRRAEERLGREVNATSYSPEEFRDKLRSHDHFLAAVLRRRKQFLKGGQSDLDEIVGK